MYTYVCLLLEPTTLGLFASGFTTNYLKYGASVALGALVRWAGCLRWPIKWGNVMARYAHCWRHPVLGNANFKWYKMSRSPEHIRSAPPSLLSGLSTAKRREASIHCVSRTNWTRTNDVHYTWCSEDGIPYGLAVMFQLFDGHSSSTT